jgi:hypothetical protein
MSEFRPTSIFVIGLLNLVIGSFGVVWNGVGAVTLIAPDELAGKYFTRAETADMAAFDRSLTTQVPHLASYRLVVMQLVPWLLTVLLLVGGVGLLKCRGWGRSVSLLYAVGSILHKIGMAIYTSVFLLPAYKIPITILELTKPVMAPGADVVANIMSIVTPLLLMTYPILVLLVMYRRAVVVALTAPPAPAPAPA